MTLEDLKHSTKNIITPAEAAQIINCNPHYIRVLARTYPERLGFPVIVFGNSSKEV